MPELKLARLIFEHLLPSIVIGLIGWMASGGWMLVPVAMATGWLIDTDHLFDFWLDRRNRPTEEGLLCSITSGSYFERNKKIIVLLHSWELVLVWFMFWLTLGNKDVAVIGSISWGVHLFIDHCSYRLSPWAYFLWYRLAHGFCAEAICLENEFSEYPHLSKKWDEMQGSYDE